MALAGDGRGISEHRLAAAGFTRTSALILRTPRTIFAIKGDGGKHSSEGESLVKSDSKPARPRIPGHGKRGRGGEIPHTDKLKPALAVRAFAAMAADFGADSMQIELKHLRQVIATSVVQCVSLKSWIEERRFLAFATHCCQD